MSETSPDKIERGARRGLGAIFGLLLGLLFGLAVGLALFGFGDALLITVAAGGLLGATLSFRWPAPVLFIAELLLSIVGIDI